MVHHSISLIIHMDTLFFVLYFGNILNYIDRGVISTLLPRFQEDFGLTAMEEGYLASAFIVGYALCCLVFSYLSGRKNKKPVLLTGIAVWISSCLLTGSAITTSGLYVARGLSGVGEAAYQTLVPTCLHNIYGDQKGGRYSGYFFTAIQIGTALGILLGGIVPHWRVVFLLEAVLGLSVLGYLLKTLPWGQLGPNGCEKIDDLTNASAQTVQPRVGDLKKIKWILTNPNWVLITCISTCCVFASGSLILWLPTFLKNTYGSHIRYEVISSYMSVSCVCLGMAGAFAAARLPIYLYGKEDGLQVGRLSNLALYANLLMIPFVCGTLIPKHHFMINYLCLSILYGLFACMSVINSWIVLRISPIAIQPYAIALNILFIHVCGDMISPPLTSWIWDTTQNLEVAIFYCMSSLMISLPLYVVFNRRNRQSCLQKKYGVSITEETFPPNPMDLNNLDYYEL